MIDWAGLLTTSTLVVDYGIKIVAVGTVSENRSPASSNAWLLAILLLPVVGLPLYLLVGSPYVQGRRRRVQELANRNIAELTASVSDLPADVEVPPGMAGVVAMNRRLTSMPCLTGENLGLLDDCMTTVAALTRLAEEARDTIHVEFYIAAWDHTTGPFFEALADAAARGVTVRFLFDHLGTRGYPGYRQLKKRLTAAGIEWHAMMPLNPLRGQWRRPDLRNHRKLVVVDNSVGFMGSMNLIDPSYLRRRNLRRRLQWLDLNLILAGPIVHQLSHVFTLDWYQETGELIHPDDGSTTVRATVKALEDAAAVLGAPETVRTDQSPREIPLQLIPSGPGFLTEPNLRLFLALIHRAQDRLEIVSPYFVPDEALLLAITSAAQRGVEVELFVSEKLDQFMVHHAQRSYYEALLRSGVRIWLYAVPTILHAKFLTVDGEMAVVGSSNMDMRSFFLDYEISLLGMDREFTEAHSRVAADYRAHSRELSLEEWLRRPWPMRYLDNVMRLTASLQ